MLIQTLFCNSEFVAFGWFCAYTNDMIPRRWDSASGLADMLLLFETEQVYCRSFVLHTCTNTSTITSTTGGLDYSDLHVADGIGLVTVADNHLHAHEHCKCEDVCVKQMRLIGCISVC